MAGRWTLTYKGTMAMSRPFGCPIALAFVGALFLTGFPLLCLAAEDGTLFQKRRTELVAKHDKNGDGRLDSAEREQMRLALKEQRLKRGSSFKLPVW